METVDISYARKHLDELLDRAANGESISIETSDKGTFELRSVASHQPSAPTQPILGQWKGRLKVPARLFEPLSDDELAWLSGEQSS